MLRTPWKVALPILQLILAAALWLYIPIQFSRAMMARMNLKPEQIAGHSLDLPPEIIHLHYPPPVGRVLYAINFPAYVLSNKVEDVVRWRTTPMLQFAIRDSGGQIIGLYNFGTRELVFVVGLCFLWLWVGARIDRCARPSSKATKKPVREWLNFLEVAAPGLGLALLLAVAVRPLVVGACLVPFRYPWREILYIGWVGLRGAVPVVLATFPVLLAAPMPVGSPAQ